MKFGPGAQIRLSQCTLEDELRARNIYRVKKFFIFLIFLLVKLHKPQHNIIKLIMVYSSLSTLFILSLTGPPRENFGKLEYGPRSPFLMYKYFGINDKCINYNKLKKTIKECVFGWNNKLKNVLYYSNRRPTLLFSSLIYKNSAALSKKKLSI